MSPLVADDDTAVGIGRVLVDPGEFQCPAVHPQLVPGEVAQRHGDVSTHRIEVLAARQAPRVGIFEVADVPSVALDPRTDTIGGPNCCGHLGDGSNGGESDVHGERGKH